MGLEQTIDITSQQRRTILALLERYLPDTEAWVYGSRANWTSRPESDLDLVVFTTREQRKQVEALREAFEESVLPFRVDLFVWDEVPVSFRRQIDEGHVTLAAPSRRPAPDEWRASTWGEEIALEYGKALRDYDAGAGHYRVFGSNGPIGWTDEALVAGPGVVLGRKGAYRGVEYSANPFFVIDTAYYVVSKAGHDMRWLLYAIKHYKLGEIDDGSPIPSTTRAAVYPRELAVPPRSEQRAIAHVLGSLDDKIDLNRRMNETLEAMARALFKSWFVDFDPVRAKREGRNTGLPQDVANLFPERLVDSELGPIPEGWEVKPLGDLLELAYGKALPQGKRRPGNIPVYGSNGPIGWHDEQLIDGPGIVVGRKGNPGLVRWSSTDFFPIDTTFYVVPKDNGLGLFFLFHVLRTQDLPSIASDSAVPGMNRNLAYMNRAFVPATPVIDAFSKRAKAISTRQHGLKKESRTLARLRDTLLPKLIAGEIRVDEAQKLTGARV